MRSIPSLRPYAIASGLLLSAGTAWAQLPQETAPLAPAAILDAFDLETGTVQDLIPLQATQGLHEVSVNLGGRERTLSLHAYDLRTPDFKLLVDDGVRIVQVPTPPSISYRGEVVGEPESLVAATLVDGRINALVEFDGTSWGIQPTDSVNAGLPRTAHVVYRRSDSKASNHTCGTTGEPVPVTPGAGTAAPGLDALEEAEIALDLDFEFYTRNGSNTTNAQNDAINVMNGVDAIYQRDVEIAYRITTIVVRTSSVSSYQNQGTNLINAFRNLWNSTQGGTQRDVAHLLSGKSTPGGVLGIASLGVVCNRSSAYGVSWSKFSNNMTRRVGLTAHELGHNWNSNHCDGQSQCRIMCSGLGGCNGILSSFGSWAISRITSFKNSRGCLTPFSQNPPTLSSISTNSTTNYNVIPVQITLTGTEMNSVSQVDVGPSTASIVSQTTTTLAFTLPNGFTIGNHSVTVSNNTGSSNALSLNVTGTSPAVLTTIPLQTSGTSADYTVYGEAGENIALFVSALNTPSALPGIVSFDIGGNFVNLLQIATIVADTGGVATLPVTMPPGTLPPLTTLYWQGLDYSGVPVAPLSTTNSVSVTYF